MNARQLVYWTTTSAIALETFAGGVIDLTHGRTNVVSGPNVADVVTGLGYPTYILEILGAWKIPGAIVLALPGFRRLKEWAYAGIVFELSGAAASQAIRGKPKEVIAPAILLGLTLASWALRPRNRTLGAPAEPSPQPATRIPQPTQGGGLI